jgi:outer membrane translocation and assembly module TamA
MALSVHYAPARNSYGLKFSGILNSLRYATGLMLQGDMRHNAIQNFFGLGNETKQDKSKDFSYYRIQFNYASADLMVIKNHFDKLSFALGPSVYYYWNNKEENKNRIIEQSNGAGLDSSSVYDKKLYLGGKLRLNVNRLDNLLFPKQGISWKNELIYYQNIIESKGSAIASLQSHILLASSLVDTSKMISLIKVGGGHIFSKGYEFFQALGLGADNNLRGFRNYRFTGSSLLYGSVELRFKLLSFQSFLLPGEIGLLGFTDVGRVWTKHTSSQLWHTAYGGGIYFFPYQCFLLSASIGKNEDGAIYNFSIGKTINWYR